LLRFVTATWLHTTSISPLALTTVTQVEEVPAFAGHGLLPAGYFISLAARFSATSNGKSLDINFDGCQFRLQAGSDWVLRPL
jgi:hypothetical protein